MHATELNLPDLRGQEPEDAKQQLRTIIRTQRHRFNEAQIHEAGRAIKAHVLELARDYNTIACYVSFNEEPPTQDLIEELYQAGKRILVPKLGPKLNRDWAYYEGKDELADRSPNRPKEPGGAAMDSSALAAVDLVLTPALAVDREGNRLGQGGGWYDRALPYVKRGTPIYALLYTQELLAHTILPTDNFDIPVSGVVTPDFMFPLENSRFQTTGELPD